MSTDSWEDYWSEVRSKTKTQRVKRTETQRLTRAVPAETEVPPEIETQSLTPADANLDAYESDVTDKNDWDDHWSGVRAKTESQRVKRTETQRLSRIDSADATHQRRDAHESGFKSGYTQALNEVMSYLRDSCHYQQPVNLSLFERWYRCVKLWRKNPDNGPPPELIWERHGKYGG